MNLKDVAESAGMTVTSPRAHMQNFLDCIRGAKPTNCPFELGYKVSIACRMAVESYLQGRTVRWDTDARRNHLAPQHTSKGRESRDGL